MRVLVLHRIPYHKVQYARGIDHAVHDVTYVGKPEILRTLPADLRCEKIERPGTEPAAIEVLRLVGNRRFDRVISLSEYELLDAARVREALGVFGPSVEEVRRVRDKVRMKAAVEAAGLRVPRYLALAEALDTGCPWAGRTVLKPIDGASSENVFVFDSPQEALQTIRSERVSSVPRFSPDRYELEEFVPGRILHLDGLVRFGRVETVLASRYVGTCLEFASGRALGSVQLDPFACGDLFDWAARVVSAVGIRTSSFHLEAIETPVGPVFLEIGARVGGADVVDTFELATGIHLPSAELSLIVDEESKASYVRPVLSPLRRYGWFVFPGHHLSSKHCWIQGTDSFRSHPQVVRWNELPVDASLPTHITYQAREVPVAGVLQGETTESVESLMDRIFETVSVLPERSVARA